MRKNAITLLIEEVNKCLESQNYLSALIVALTIPDICGKILFPEDKPSQRYKQWFDKYIGNHEQSPLEKDLPESEQSPYMTGETLYQLRCAMLHEGSDDIADKIEVNELNFHYGKDAVVESTCIRQRTEVLLNGEKRIYPKVRTWDINVYDLCKKIVWSAEFFLKNEVDNLSKLPTIQYNI